jgi:hypothetical protein
LRTLEVFALEIERVTRKCWTAFNPAWDEIQLYPASPDAF